MLPSFLTAGFSANLSDLHEILAPGQPMVNDISRQLDAGGLRRPSYVAFRIANSGNVPWGLNLPRTIAPLTIGSIARAAFAQLNRFLFSLISCQNGSNRPYPAGRVHISRGIPRHFPGNSPGNAAVHPGFPMEFPGEFHGWPSKFPGEFLGGFPGCHFPGNFPGNPFPGKSISLEILGIPWEISGEMDFHGNGFRGIFPGKCG